MSITMSGLILGLAMARVFAGILADETSWRNTYWLAVGLQGGEISTQAGHGSRKAG